MPKRNARKVSSVYYSIASLPATMYPFRAKVDGRWVRGSISYEHALRAYQRKHGAPRYGFKLAAYRTVFHVAGSILFILVAAFVAKSLFDSETALYSIVALAILYITFQEFYFQLKMRMQRFPKAVLDWVAWVGPMAAYLWLHF